MYSIKVQIALKVINYLLAKLNSIKNKYEEQTTVVVDKETKK
jgi:hypothetical protein